MSDIRLYFNNLWPNENLSLTRRPVFRRAFTGAFSPALALLSSSILLGPVRANATANPPTWSNPSTPGQILQESIVQALAAMAATPVQFQLNRSIRSPGVIFNLSPMPVLGVIGSNGQSKPRVQRDCLRYCYTTWNSVGIYESGVYQTEIPFTNGDVFKISVSAGQSVITRTEPSFSAATIPFQEH